MNESSTRFWKYFIDKFLLIATLSGFVVWLIQSVEFKTTWTINLHEANIILVVLSCFSILIILLIGLLRYRPLREPLYENGVCYLSAFFNNISEPPADWKYHAVSTEVELKEIWKISQELYGNDNVPYEIVVTWWKCYPDGIFLLYRHNSIAGYFSMWPIKKTTFDNILFGRRKERELRQQSIIGKKSSEKRPYWYITNVVICHQFRNTKAIKILMREALRNWLKVGNLPDEVKLCTFGYTEEGKRLIERSDFKLIKAGEDTADRKPLYVFSSSRHSIDALISRLQNEDEKTNSTNIQSIS